MDTDNNKSQSILWVILPLVLAQFIASYAASNMNVAVNDIARDIGTDISGVQTAITLFTLTMAALMLPGSKLTDILGRKFCFQLGMIVYGIGAIIATISQGLPSLIIGYSVLEGVGSALMIPPIYILTTVIFSDIKSRAKAFGLISAAAGLGASAGPLIGELITSAISWRASFLLQVAVVIGIIWLGRKIFDPGITGEKPKFDLLGAALSAGGLLFIVIGILQAKTSGWISIPVLSLAAIGAFLLFLFFREITSKEKRGEAPLLAPKLFKNVRSNLGLITQNIQWLIMQGTFFVISVFLQTVLRYNAIETGLILIPAILGILLSSGVADRLAQRHEQRNLIRAGFITTLAGTVALLFAHNIAHSVILFIPGLFFMGAGIGVMLTSSVNVVQSSFGERDQGEISGLSRSVSNLGSSLGTAIVGTVLVSSIGDSTFGLAIITMLIFGGIGLIASFLLPRDPEKTLVANP